MQTKKQYAAPAITGEDRLERTSLACDVIEHSEIANPIGPESWCDTNISKGAAFSSPQICSDLFVIGKVLQTSS